MAVYFIAYEVIVHSSILIFRLATNLDNGEAINFSMKFTKRDFGIKTGTS